ncbi:MAG: DUF2167 domain-containing protein [Myxococcota bacterium]
MRSLLLPLLLLSWSSLAQKPVKPTPAAPAPAAEPADTEAAAEDGEPEPLPPGMTEGPAHVKVGANAELDLPQGVIFGDAKVAKDILERSGNLTNGQEVGILLNAQSSVIFEFDPVGYVKDDDKEALDADKMLTALRENQEEANSELERRGLDALELTGWQVKPHYDPATHNLEWAPLVKNKKNGHETVNYNVRILGRRGVMEATLLVSPDKFDAELPGFRQSLKGFTFTKGEDYMSWVKGDKVAEYGLAALVTGGAVAVAAKSGLLGKLIKPLIVAVGAALAAIKRFFTGKKSTSVVESDKDRTE